MTEIHSLKALTITQPPYEIPTHLSFNPRHAGGPGKTIYLCLEMKTCADGQIYLIGYNKA